MGVKYQRNWHRIANCTRLCGLCIKLVGERRDHVLSFLIFTTQPYNFLVYIYFPHICYYLPEKVFSLYRLWCCRYKFLKSGGFGLVIGVVIAAPWAIAAPRTSFLRGGLSDDQLLTSASVDNEVSLWYARVFIFGVTIHNGAAGTLWLIVVAMGRCSNLILGAKRFRSFECYDSMPS